MPSNDVVFPTAVILGTTAAASALVFYAVHETQR